MPRSSSSSRPPTSRGTRQRERASASGCSRRSARSRPASHAIRNLAHPQEKRDEHPVRYERRAPVRDERKGNAGERDEPRVAADDDKRLEGDDEGKARSEELQERRGRAQCDDHPPIEEQQIEREERQRAGETGLLRERVEHEVAPHDGDPIRHAVAEPGAEESAVAERVEPLHELIAGAEAKVIVERPKPRVDACLNVTEQLIRDEPTDEQQRQAEDGIETLARREKEHGQEDPEEERGRADVFFEDHDKHRDPPHRDDRHEVRDRRDREWPDAALRLREHLPVLLEVGGEEDDEQQLHGLPWLDRSRAHLDPDPRAVDLAADDREERRDEKKDAEKGPGPLEPREGGEIAWE